MAKKAEKKNVIPKTKTGINGLDGILEGGVPSASLTLINGSSGTGKTLLGLEFIYKGALEKKPGLFVTFEERAENLRRNAATLGWEIKEMEKKNLFSFLEVKIDPEAVMSGHFDLGAILAILEQKVKEIKADRVVIDGPDVLLRLMDDERKERTELYKINEWLKDNKITTMMTIKGGKDFDKDNRYEFMDYLADCVILLDQRVQRQIATRRMRIVKYRGSDFGRNEFPFAIFKDGLHIIPVTKTALTHRKLGKTIDSGVPQLNKILDGGFRKSSCNLVSGSSGTGKTTLACSFVRKACENNEKVLYLDFEESQEAMISGMMSPGIDLKPAIKKGLLRMESIMPEALGVEEHLIRAFRIIEDFNPPYVIVDAISACDRMGDKDAAFDYLLRLIDFCKSRGITTLLTNLTASYEENNEITGIDLSSVIDTVILLRNIEYQAEMQRILLVLKSRGRAHSNKCHKFLITNNGIKIEEFKDKIPQIFRGGAK